MKKEKRQKKILELIGERAIGTQEELTGALREAGYPATQATVSRDIKELRLLKVLSGSGGYKYATADKAEHGLSERFVRMFKDSVLSINFACNIVVIKTLAGSANVAAEAIDSMHLPEILGTMAGDNTVLVIVKNETEAAQTVNRFRDMLK